MRTLNYRELFTIYHVGFQNYGPWLDHHLEMHERHPLGCAEFDAEWLRRWEAFGRLLDAPCTIRWYNWVRRRWETKIWSGTVAEAIDYVLGEYNLDPDPSWRWMRVVLLDGTIVREWGAP